jgi:P27 family predicted phage terminase small subunit
VGKRGPKPLPTAIRLARGTYRPDRSAINEPIAAGRPKPPAMLKSNPDALKEFRRLVKELSALGILGSVDANALARYAVLWVRWRQAEEMLRRTGDTLAIRDADGKVKHVIPSPHVSITRSLSEQLGRLEGEFGMTPSSRSRIEVQPPAPVATREGKSRFFGDLN